MARAHLRELLTEIELKGKRQCKTNSELAQFVYYYYSRSRSARPLPHPAAFTFSNLVLHLKTLPLWSTPPSRLSIPAFPTASRFIATASSTSTAPATSRFT